MADDTTTITWRDRTIPIKLPGGMQLATWNRVAKQAAELGGGEGELTEDEKTEMATLLDRLLRIILSLFANNADKEWLQDLLLDGEITDEDLLAMFSQMTDGMTDGDTAKKAPAKKAARKA